LVLNSSNYEKLRKRGGCLAGFSHSETKETGGKLKGVPEKRKKLVRGWYTKLRAMTKKTSPPAILSLDTGMEKSAS